MPFHNPWGIWILKFHWFSWFATYRESIRLLTSRCLLLVLSTVNVSVDAVIFFKYCNCVWWCCHVLIYLRRRSFGEVVFDCIFCVISYLLVRFRCLLSLSVLVFRLSSHWLGWSWWKLMCYCPLRVYNRDHFILVLLANVHSKIEEETVAPMSMFLSFS